MRATSANITAEQRRIGTTVGAYRLIELLGQGGMGTVYKAEHQHLGRIVAVKMLRPQYSVSSSALKRLYAEARAANRVCHQNVVEITDYIENDGLSCFIMEYLEGETLGDLQERETPLPLSRCLGIAVQVASALSAVHAAQIIHRDLKPHNIFLTNRDGRRDFVKLLDFGLAKLLRETTPSLEETAAGALLGTPSYMSPEQASSKQTDHRTDIYALGTILYEMITGRLPFEAANFGELVLKITGVEPTRPSKVRELPRATAKDLDELVLWCLAKSPNDRPQRAAVVEKRLLAIAQSQAIEFASFVVAKVPPLPAKTAKRRHRIVMAVLAMLIGVVAVFSVATTRQSSDTRVAATRQSSDTRVAATKPTSDTKDGQPQALAASPRPRVQVTFATTPPGAMVFPSGETVPLGVTPLTISLDEDPGYQTFEFRKSGYESESRKVLLRSNAKVELALRQVSPEKTESHTAAKVTERADRGKSPTRSRAHRSTRWKSRGEHFSPAGQSQSKIPASRRAVVNPFAEKKR